MLKVAEPCNRERSGSTWWGGGRRPGERRLGRSRWWGGGGETILTTMGRIKAGGRRADLPGTAAGQGGKLSLDSLVVESDFHNGFLITDNILII